MDRNEREMDTSREVHGLQNRFEFRRQQASWRFFGPIPIDTTRITAEIARTRIYVAGLKPWRWRKVQAHHLCTSNHIYIHYCGNPPDTFFDKIPMAETFREMG
jgi:hypothetical protein